MSPAQKGVNLVKSGIDFFCDTATQSAIAAFNSACIYTKETQEENYIFEV